MDIILSITRSKSVILDHFSFFWGQEVKYSNRSHLEATQVKILGRVWLEKYLTFKQIRFPSKLSDFLQGCKNYVWTNRRVYHRTMQTRRLATPTRWVINFADLRCDWRVIATAYTRIITNPRCHTQHTYTQVMVNTAKILLMCLVYQATLIGMVHLHHGSAV